MTNDAVNLFLNPASDLDNTAIDYFVAVDFVIQICRSIFTCDAAVSCEEFVYSNLVEVDELLLFIIT